MLKSIKYLFFLLTLSILIMAQNNENIHIVKTLIEKYTTEYRPDKRVAVFDIISESCGNKIILSGESNSAQALSALLKELADNNITIENKIESLPSENLEGNFYGIITLSVANLRSKPAHSAEMATQALLGTPVKVLKKHNGYYLIQTPDKYISWVDSPAISVIKRDAYLKWSKSNRIIFTEEYGHCYEKPDINSRRVSDLVAGNILEQTEISDNFIGIKFPDGRTAYVEKKLCADFNEWLKNCSPTPDNILKTAEKLIGIPYLWGGTSIKGMDCSGFIKTIFFLNGLVLPRDASQQVFTGENITVNKDFTNLEKGDLLFFGTQNSNDKKERITHVGISLGNQEFIHASGKVRINSFNPSAFNFTDDYIKIFVRAKRLLNPLSDVGIEMIEKHAYYMGDI